MKKNGFTLIEVLGVVALLAIISTIVFVVVEKNMKDSKETLYKAQLEDIRSAAGMWMADNIEKIPEEGYYTVLLSYLQNNGYIGSNIKNPKTNEMFSPYTIIRIGMKDILVGEETGFESADSAMLSVSANEISLLESKLEDLEDGIYYYDTNGNLEINGDIIRMNSIRNNPRGNVLISNHTVVNACFNYEGKNYEYSFKDGFSVRSFPCSTVRGENLIVNGDLSYGDNTNFSQLTYNDEGYLTVSGSSFIDLNDDDFIPIDINKKYEIGITAQSNNQDARYYFGFVSYDVDKNIIVPMNFFYVPDTLTTLAKDLNIGDEYIYLTNMENWNVDNDNYYEKGFIFWNYIDSTGYQYPELTYSRNSFRDMYEKSDIELNIDLEGEVVNRIKLKAPWSEANGKVLAGTKLSQVSGGNTYNYFYNGHINLSNTFDSYKKSFMNINPNGINDMNKFRIGTKYIKLLVRNNYDHLPNIITSYKDFYIREVLD